MIKVSDLRVAAVQSNIIWQNVEGNLAYLSNLLSPLSGSADVIVLPEMFSTGFTMNPSVVTTKEQEITLLWMKNMAADFSIAVCGSIVFFEKEKYYNRFIWVDEYGNYSFYDKKHLFSFAGEHLHYTPGNEKIIIQYKGWRILPQICYDLRFSESSMNVLGHYDILLYVANFPSARQYAWDHLLISRAIENQSYTIGVNRVGIDGNNHEYGGGSVILSYDGIPLSTAGREEQIITHTLRFDDQMAFRTQFPFLNDIKVFG
jgi:predicted amidohydrolase